MDIRKLVGENVRELRQAKGWSQEELGHDAQLHRTYISQIERGAINPSIVVIEKLAITLGVKPATLFANWRPPRSE